MTFTPMPRFYRMTSGLVTSIDRALGLMGDISTHLKPTLISEVTNVVRNKQGYTIQRRCAEQVWNERQHDLVDIRRELAVLECPGSR